ncbi:MAG: hypothetical protein AAGK32_20310 [Actinomycetota bacterium]
MRRLRTLALVLAAGLLLLTACGDDSDSSQSDTSASDSEPSAESGDGDVDLPGGGDIEVPGLSEECETVAEASIQAAGAAVAAFDPTGDIGETTEFFDGAIDAAPDELKDDFEVLAEGLAQYAQALQDAGADLSDPSSFTDPATISALTEAAEVFSTAEFEQAGENISAWAEANCDVADPTG